MTPWLGWTWNHLGQSAALKFFCWQQCLCSHARQAPRSRPMNLVWYWLSQTSILNIDSAVSHPLLEAAQSKTPYTLSTRHWRFIGHTSLGLNEHGDLRLYYYQGNKAHNIPLINRRLGIVYPWPEHLLGPKDGPRDLTQNPFTMPGERGNPFDQHYNTCDGPLDCTPSADSAEQTHCAIIPKPLQRMLNFDAVFPALGLCLTMAQMTILRRAKSSIGTGTKLEGFNTLFGREVKEDMVQFEPEILHLECYCNATHVDESCCIWD
jgi:hypothetical protein